jgi:hypothetical protein
MTRLRPLSVLAALGAAWIILFVTLPTATPQPITIDVTCQSGNAVAGVWIQADNGGSNWATLVDRHDTSTRYSFVLRFAGNYQVRAGCGGTSNNWATQTNSTTNDAAYRNLLCKDGLYHPPNPAPCVDVATR